MLIRSIKTFLFFISSITMWPLMYVLINTSNGNFSHNFLSGLLIVVPVLILNFFGSAVFMQAMSEQDKKIDTK